VVTATGLIRIYRLMVITSLLVGWISFFDLLGFLATPEMSAVRLATGSGLLISPGILQYAYQALQAAFLLSAVGLVLLRWWGRLLFVATYAVNAVLALIGGVQVWMPWDSFLWTGTSLLDGAIMVLSFLPPISGHFSRERDE
jgi:hypothetical protein